MKKHVRRILSLILSFAILLSLAPAYAAAPVTVTSAYYRDISDHWAESYIETWSDRGIVRGYNGEFRPNDPITRGEVAQIITNLLCLTEEMENPFTDLEADAWYTSPVLKCVAGGFLLGSGSLFRPTDAMTREEAMTLMARVLKMPSASDTSLLVFQDADLISKWARDAVAALAAAGIVTGEGNGKLAPKRNITRAEILALLSKAISEYINKPGVYALDDKNGSGIVLVAVDGAVLTGTIPGRLVITGGAAGGTVCLDGLAANQVDIVSQGVTVNLKNNTAVENLVVADSAAGTVINQSANSTMKQMELLEDTVINKSELVVSQTGIHIGAINEAQHIITLHQAPTYIYTVDTNKGEGYTVLQAETVNELISELSAPNGKLTVMAGGVEKAASDPVNAGDIVRITTEEYVTDYTVEIKEGAIRGEAEAVTPVVTVGAASDIVLYLTAGLRSPQTRIVVNVPAGINATLDNTTVDVIGRGTVTLRELSTQSMGKTFSEYDHDAVGQVSIQNFSDGTQCITFSGLDLRAQNGHDLELTFKNVKLNRAGEYSFSFSYSTSAITQNNGLLPSYEKKELPALVSPPCQVNVAAVTPVSSFAREISTDRVYNKNTDYQSAAFTWTEPIGADSITMLYSIDRGQTWDTYGAVANGYASVSGLIADTEYWFKLSVSGGANAGDSNIAKVYTGMLDVRRFGAIANDNGNDRDAIDEAIQYLYDLGGGTLLFTDGTYDMNTVHLKSNVYLYIDVSATLRALKNTDAPETTWWSDKDYRSGTSATSTGPYNDPNNYLTKQDVGHTYFRNCMFFAEREDNIKIIGNGTITGNGNLNTSDSVMNNSADNRADKMFVMKLCTNIEIGGLTKGNTISDYDLWYYETDTPNTDQPFYVVPEKAIDREYIENALTKAGVSITSPTKDQLNAIDGIDTNIDNMLHIARAGHFVLLATGTDGIDTHDVYAEKSSGGVRDIFDYMESGDVRAINIYAEGSSDDIVKPGSDCSLGFTRPVSNFKVRNIIGDTNCNLFQIGSETADDIQNIYIDNIYVLAGNKAGFSISTNDGAYVKNIFLNAGGTNPDHLESPAYICSGMADTSRYAKTSEMRRTRAPFFISISNRGRTMGGAATRYSYDDGTGNIVNQLLSDNVAIGRVENIMIHNVNVEELYGGSRYNNVGGRWSSYGSQNKAAPIISGYAVPTVFHGESKPDTLPVLHKDGTISYDGSRQTGYIENIGFTNVAILAKGGNTLENGNTLTPEMAVGKYNVGDLALDAMGTGLPAYGFWFRHVENLTMENCSSAYEKNDDRYAIVFDDVLGADVSKLSMQRGKNNRNLIQIRSSFDISVTNSSYYLTSEQSDSIALNHETVAGIQTYPFKLSSNTGIVAAEGITLDGNTITVPYSTTLKALKKALTSTDGSNQTYTVAGRKDGDRLEPNDILTVTAEDGTKAVYTIIEKVSSNTNILAEIGDIVFSFEDAVLRVNKDRIDDLISAITSADGSVQTYRYADGILLVIAADGMTTQNYTVEFAEDIRLFVKNTHVQVIDIEELTVRALRGTTVAQLKNELSAPDGAELTVTADAVTVSKNGESLTYRVVYETSPGGGVEVLLVEGETGTYTVSGITGDKTNSGAAHGGKDRQFTGPAGAYVDYTFTVPSSGSYSFTYGYKLKKTSRTTTDILVNGKKVGEINHLTTNDAEENLYTSSDFEVGYLSAGEATVRFLITGSTNSFMVDYFALNTAGGASGSTNIEVQGMAVDNDAKTLMPRKQVTVSNLLTLLASCDGSKQTYRITDAAGNDKTEGSIMNGDILVVTSQDQAYSASYAISGVPELSSSTQIILTDSSIATLQGSVIKVFEGTTAAEVKAVLAAADESVQAYAFSSADHAALTASDSLTVTAADGVSKSTYTFMVLEIPFELVIAENAAYTRGLERYASEANGERNNYNAILTPGVTAGDIKNEIVPANSRQKLSVRVLDHESKPLKDTDLIYEGDTIVFTSGERTISMTALVYYDYIFATGKDKASLTLAETVSWENCTFVKDGDNLNAKSAVADVTYQPYAKSTNGANGGWFQLTGQVDMAADYRLDYVYKGQANRGAVSLYVDGSQSALFSDFNTTTESAVPESICYKQYLGATKYAVKSLEAQHFAKGKHSFRFTASDNTQVLSVAIQLHFVRGSSNNELSMRKGDEVTLSPQFPSLGETNTAIKWATSSAQIAEVHSGKVTATGVGEATVTATSWDNSFFDTWKITVTDQSVDVESLTINKTETVLAVGESGLLGAYANPWFADDCSVNWTSSDESTVTVSNSGVIVGKKQGQATITAVAANTDIKAQCVVTVTDSLLPFNLHCPAEARSYDALTLLWDKSSDLYTTALECYVVYQNGQEIGTTDKMGFSVRDLDSDTPYTFRVDARHIDGKVEIGPEITVRTKPAPTAIINIMDEPYHAVPDGGRTETNENGNTVSKTGQTTGTVNTKAIQKAIDDCPEGGEVYIPEGVFVTGALFLKSNMILRIDGTLIGSTNLEDYPQINCMFEGWEIAGSYASLLTLGELDVCGQANISNVVICGNGKIDGSGLNLDYAMGGSGSNSTTNPQLRKRSRSIVMMNAENIYIRDLEVYYGPAWTIHAIVSSGITFDGLYVESKDGSTRVRNGDGIGSESSSNINYFDCTLWTGDDSITIKSGKNLLGWQRNIPCRNIRITNCTAAGAQGGFVIGSEMSGGVKNVLMQDNVINDPNWEGIDIKSDIGRGGLVETILYRDMYIDKARIAVRFSFKYSTNNDGDGAPVPPALRNILLENVTGTGNSTAIEIIGLPSSRISNITMVNCNIKGNEKTQEETGVKARAYLQDVENSSFENVIINDNTGKAWGIVDCSNINGIPLALQVIDPTNTQIAKLAGDTKISAVDNESKQITVKTDTTVKNLLAALTASDGSKQSYVVQDINGEIKSESDEITETDVLIVTSQDGTVSAVYSITRLAPSSDPLRHNCDELSYTKQSASSINTASNDRNSKYVQFKTKSSVTVGDWLEFQIPDVPAGTYHVALRFKYNTNGRGAADLFIDGGAAALGTVDEETGGEAGVYHEPTIGQITFSEAGNHAFRFVVTRVNNLTFDQIILTPVNA